MIILFRASPNVSIASPVKSPLHNALLSLVVTGAITLSLNAFIPTYKNLFEYVKYAIVL